MKTALIIATLSVIALASISAVYAAEARDWKAEIQQTITEHDVVLYGKSYCPYCRYVVSSIAFQLLIRWS